MSKKWIGILIIIGGFLAFVGLSSDAVLWQSAALIFIGLKYLLGITVTGAFILAVIATDIHSSIYLYKHTPRGIVVWIILNLYAIIASYIYFGLAFFVMLMCMLWYWSFIGDPMFDEDHKDRVYSIPRLKAWLDKTKDSDSKVTQVLRHSLLLYTDVY